MTLTGFVSAVMLITEVQMLTIIRGLPGSGKSTLAHSITEKVCEADQYFMQDGEYIFVPADITKAHIACQQKVDAYLRAGVPVAMVPHPVDAVRHAMEGAAAGDVVIVTGSFYLAGVIQKYLPDTYSPAICTLGD